MNPDYFLGDYLGEYTEGSFEYHHINGERERFKIAPHSHHGETFEGIEAVANDFLNGKGFTLSELPPIKFRQPFLQSCNQSLRAYSREDRKIILDLHMPPYGTINGSVFPAES